jgi:hypothetical protein
MEKAAAAGTTGVRWEIASSCVTLAALACLAAPAAAQEAAAPPAEVLVAEAKGEPSMRVQVQTSALPRIDALDSGFQAPRVDVSLFPSPRTTGLSAVFGLSTPRPGINLQPTAAGSVDVGLRWTQRLQGRNLIDVTAWRRMNAEQHDAVTLLQMREPTVYGARVELNLKPVRKAGLTFDRGIGLQLESGARISIKRKNGGPMVYYRTSF